MNALKFFAAHILHRPIKIKIPIPKRSKRLPIILMRTEIARILESTKNLKHKLIISLAYGAGLRVSEVVRLRVGNINFAELTIHIHQAKGQRDRITVLPESIAPQLTVLITNRAEDDFVFISERGGRLTERSAQKILEIALRRAGIQKAATFHSLRHSFATHVLEDGVDVRYVQELLGHANIRTTQRYTQMTTVALRKIRSPLG